MPLKPIDYSKTIFYRIVCNDLNIKDCYIGHTTNFIKRKQNHKRNCNNINSNKYFFKVYDFIRENRGWDNWSMVMIEEISCENLNEACKLERKFIEEYNTTLNIAIPTRTKNEWCKIYHENNKEKEKEYVEKNKEKIREYRKNYYKNNKDKIKKQSNEYYKNKQI